MAKYWDGNESLGFVFDDGGRAASGRKGFAGDCVCRSIAIVSGLDYSGVYDDLASGTAGQMATSRTPKRARSARNGINVRRKWFRDWMVGHGFVWHPTMQVGQGCTVHLLSGELPPGRLVVSLSRHYTAVIDGVIHDTYDPTRCTLVHDENGDRLSHRCVYGYWKFA